MLWTVIGTEKKANVDWEDLVLCLFCFVLTRWSTVSRWHSGTSSLSCQSKTQAQQMANGSLLALETGILRAAGVKEKKQLLTTVGIQTPRIGEESRRTLKLGSTLVFSKYFQGHLVIQSCRTFLPTFCNSFSDSISSPSYFPHRQGNSSSTCSTWKCNQSTEICKSTKQLLKTFHPENAKQVEMQRRQGVLVSSKQHNFCSLNSLLCCNLHFYLLMIGSQCTSSHKLPRSIIFCIYYSCSCIDLYLSEGN